MGLFRSRTRLKHKILIALDVAVQDCQRKINESKAAFNQSTAVAQADLVHSLKSMPTMVHYQEEQHIQDIKTLNTLKDQLLSNVKKIEEEIRAHQRNIR